MDPDAALAEARAAVQDYKDGVYPDDNQLYRVMVAFKALDEWISRGGFLPEEWASTVGALPST